MAENIISSDNNNNSDGIVKRDGWTVYFYAEVTVDSAQKLIEFLSDIDREHKMAQIDGYYPQIKLRIQSDGGDVQAAFGIIDFIQSMKSYKYLIAIVDGWAASAATMIAVACHKVYMGRNGEWLIHQLSGWAYGKLDDMVDFTDSAKKAQKRIMRLYLNNTKLTKKTLKEKIKREWFVNFDEALELGLIDGDLSNVK